MPHSSTSDRYRKNFCQMVKPDVNRFGSIHTATNSCSVMQKLHPAILELGLAYSDGTIKGSSARSIAMMLAMRCVVREYVAPPTQAFSRALTAHINACVGFLWDECRPACVPQRNSIKWLKSTIHNVRVPSPLPLDIPLSFAGPLYFSAHRGKVTCKYLLWPVNGSGL